MQMAGFQHLSPRTERDTMQIGSEGGPLNEGTLDGSTVTCPWHGSQFDVCTGAVLRGPAGAPLKAYRVIVEGDIGRVEAG
jgi:nitrite reductase/ring-hydroxylating ferredoxin subunit